MCHVIGNKLALSERLTVGQQWPCRHERDHMVNSGAGQCLDKRLP
jgi:hypothetical protein